jgi:hypothetical protein
MKKIKMKGEIIKQWLSFFTWATADYRKNYPDDHRTDVELIRSLTEAMVESGIIKKSNKGKYLLPCVNGLEEFLRKRWH